MFVVHLCFCALLAYGQGFIYCINRLLGLYQHQTRALSTEGRRANLLNTLTRQPSRSILCSNVAVWRWRIV